MFYIAEKFGFCKEIKINSSLKSKVNCVISFLKGFVFVGSNLVKEVEHILRFILTLLVLLLVHYVKLF
jgi:hypothetical protein